MQDDLAARLEAATEGSRELSDAVLVKVGWTCDGVLWTAPCGFSHYHPRRQPDPTRDLNAIVAMYGEATIDLHAWTGDGDGKRYVVATVSFELGMLDYLTGKTQRPCTTPALALCAALVRALESKP